MRKRRLAVTIGTSAALLAAIAPAVNAAKPIRTPVSPSPLVLPSGLGCAFDVQLTPDADYRQTSFEFSDGRLMYSTNGSSTVTNLDDPSLSTQIRERGTVEFLYDEQANDFAVTASGQSVFYFFPGDQGPFGPVGADGGLFWIIGHVSETWDLDTDTITSFSYSGQAIDLCAEIAP
jgi:hypothetical protein